MILLPIITSNSDSIVATSNPSADDMGNSEILRLSSRESINESETPFIWCINWSSYSLFSPIDLQCKYRCVDLDGTRGEWSLPLNSAFSQGDDINWLPADCSGGASHPTNQSCDDIEIKCEKYGITPHSQDLSIETMNYNLDEMNLYSKNLDVHLIHPVDDWYDTHPFTFSEDTLKTTKKIEILRQHPQTILKTSVNGGVNPGGTQGFEEDSGEFIYTGVCAEDCLIEWADITSDFLPLVSTYMTLDASDSHIESCAYSDKSVSTKENRTYCGTDGKEFLGYLWNFQLLDTDYNGLGYSCENDSDCQGDGECYNPVDHYCQSSNPIVSCTDSVECSSWNNYCTCESPNWSGEGQFNSCIITACWEESNGYYNCKSLGHELSVVTTNSKVQVFVSGCESLPFFDENTQTKFGILESKVTSFILPNQYHNVDIDVQDFGSLASTFSSEGDNPNQWIWGNTEYKNITLKPGGIIPKVRESGISKIPQVAISGGYVSNSHLGINHYGNDVYINEVEEFTLKELDFYESVNTGCRPDSAINLIEKHVNSGGSEFGVEVETDFLGSGQDFKHYNMSDLAFNFMDSVSSCQVLPLIGTNHQADDNSNVSNQMNYRQSYQQNEIVNSFQQKLFIKDGIFNKNQGLADVYVYEKSQVNDITVAYPTAVDSQIFRYGSPYQGVSVSQYENVELDDNVSTKNLQILSYINIPDLNSHREQLRRLKSLSVSRDSLSHPIKWYLSPVSSPDTSRTINFIEDPDDYKQLEGPAGISAIVRDMGAQGEYQLYWDQLSPHSKVTTTKEEVRGGDSVIVNWSDSHTSGLPGSSIKQYCIQQINPWPIDVYESDWLHVHPYTWNSFDNDSQCPEHTNQDNCNSDSNCYWFANSPWLNGAGHCISSQDPASVGNLEQSILNRTIPGWRCFDWDSDGKNERAIKIPRQIESHSDDGQIYHILFKTKIIESVNTGLTDNVEEVPRYLASEPKYFSLRILPNNPSEFPNSDKLVPKEVYSHFHMLSNELTEGKPSRVFIRDIFDNKLNIGGIIESDFWLNYYQSIDDDVYLPTYNAGELYPTIPNFKITDSYWKSANNTGDYFVSFGNPTDGDGIADGIGGIVSSLGDGNANPDNLPTSAQAAFLVFVRSDADNGNLHSNSNFSDDLIVVYFKDGQFYWDDNSPPSFSQFIPSPYDFIIARLDVDQGIRTYSNSNSGLSNLDYINPNLYDWMENFLQTAEGCHKSIKSIGKWDESYFQQDIIDEFGFDSDNWISNEYGGWDFFLMPFYPSLYSLPRDDWSFTKLDNNCMLSNPSKGCCYIDVEYEFLQQLGGEDDPPELIYGCTDESSCNFNPQANASDNSCDYSCFGCMDSEALNYSSLATIDDGSCTYAPVVGCMDASAENYNPLAVEPCENCCDYRGCQNEWAGNYDPQANIGSDQTECVFLRDCVDFSAPNTCEDGVFQHYCKWNSNTNECMCRAPYAGDGGRNCNLIHPDHPLGIGNCETIGGAYSYGTQGCMECWTLQMLDDFELVLFNPSATSCHSVSECDIYTACYNPNGPGYSDYCCREAEDFEDFGGDWIPPEGVDDTTGGTSSQCPPGMTQCPPTSGGYTCHSCHCENGQNYTAGPTCVNGSYSDCANPQKQFYPISNCDINGCTGSPCVDWWDCGNTYGEQCEKMLQCVKEYYDECSL